MKEKQLLKKARNRTRGAIIFLCLPLLYWVVVYGLVWMLSYAPLGEFLLSLGWDFKLPPILTCVCLLILLFFSSYLKKGIRRERAISPKVVLLFKVFFIIALAVNCVGNVCFAIYHYSISAAPPLMYPLFISLSLIAGAFMLSAFGKLKE